MNRRSLLLGSLVAGAAGLFGVKAKVLPPVEPDYESYDAHMDLLRYQAMFPEPLNMTESAAPLYYASNVLTRYYPSGVGAWFSDELQILQDRRRNDEIKDASLVHTGNSGDVHVTLDPRGVWVSTGSTWVPVQPRPVVRP